MAIRTTKYRGSFDPSQANHVETPCQPRSARGPVSQKHVKQDCSRPRADITIYTDGGCWPNDGTGKGGWGFVCVETGFEDCGGAEPTTNNRMEIEAVIAAIWHHREINGIGQSLRIVSDSQYVVNACTSWMKKWKASGWKKSGGLKNADLWQQMDEAMEGVDVRFEWVRGHNGNEYNELADRLAEKGAKGGSSEEVNSEIDREFADMFR